MKKPKGSPCEECPFKKKSLQGYVGNTTVAEFVMQAEGGASPMPCHMEVDYEKKDWKKQQEKVHQCSGHAIFLSNMCKGHLGPGVERLPRDTETVFQFPSQMLQYHSKGALQTTADAYNEIIRLQRDESDEEPAKDSSVGRDTKALVDHVRELSGISKGVKMQSLAAWINRGVAYTHRLCRASSQLIVDDKKVRVRDYTVRLNEEAEDYDPDEDPLENDDE